MTKKILQALKDLKQRYGPQGWWPRVIQDPIDPPFEVALGAILTQNTTWKNVERALIALANQDLLTPEALVRASPVQLENAIHSAGYFRQKTKKIKLFSEFVLQTCAGDLRSLSQMSDKRERLLHLWGIGPETADTILLYGLDQPFFVVDSYTRRWLSHVMQDSIWLTRPYEEVRSFCEMTMPRSIVDWQEAHAVIVQWGKGSQECLHERIC